MKVTLKGELEKVYWTLVFLSAGLKARYQRSSFICWHSSDFWTNYIDDFTFLIIRLQNSCLWNTYTILFWSVLNENIVTWKINVFSQIVQKNAKKTFFKKRGNFATRINKIWIALLKNVWKIRILSNLIIEGYFRGRIRKCY